MTEKLIKGYRRYRARYFQQNLERLEEQALGRQTPDIAMVACCDSRVDPGILFDAEPGEIFVIRNVANLVPPFEEGGHYHGTSAALEFAVTGLDVTQIVVLGHANCGGIRALMENDTTIKPDGFVDRWMQLAAPAKREVLARGDLETLDQRTLACEQAAVRYSLSNLMSYPWIRSRVENGDLSLVGLYYDLRNGRIGRIHEDNNACTSL